MSLALQSAADGVTRAVAKLSATHSNVSPEASDAVLDELLKAAGIFSDGAVQIEQIAQLATSAIDGTPPTSIYLSSTATQVIASTQGLALGITERMQRLSASVNLRSLELTEQIELLRGDLSDALDAADAFADNMSSEVEDLQSTVDDLVRNAIADTADKLDARLQNLKEATAEQLRETPCEFVKEMEDAITEWLGNAQEVLTAAADNLQAEVANAVEDLQDEIGTSAKDAIDAKAREILEKILRDLVSDVLESTMLSQVGVTLTSTLSPVLPQLIAAKLLLGEIKSLLEAMRMGS